VTQATDIGEVVGEVVGERYRIVAVLGRGGVATTYKVEPLTGGEPLALKELALRGVRDWKIVELFEREGQTLRALDHPSIPRYVDAFEAEGPRGRCFYLAQALAPGRSLADRIADEWRPSEAEVRRIVDATLEILEYLHERTPPVLHRDIKPANLVLADDGVVRLVDFGAVQLLVGTQTGGSTLVGTYGYIAPEQLRGYATPATDIYGLAATALHLATRRTIADVPHRGQRVDLRKLPLSPGLRRFIERGLEPDPDRRLSDASRARQVLANKHASARSRATVTVAAGLALVGSVFVLGPHHPAITTQSAASVAHRSALVPSPAPPSKTLLPFSDVMAVEREPDLEFRAQQGSITSLAASVGSSYLLATGSADGTVRLWQSGVGGTLKGVLPGHRGAVHAIAFSRDRRTVYTADDEALRAWDATTLAPRFTVKGHGAALTALSISMDGKLVAASSDDGTVIVWSADGVEQRTLKPPIPVGHMLSAQFRPGGPTGFELVASGDSGDLYRFGVVRGDVLPSLRAAESVVTHLAGDGGPVFAIDESGVLSAWQGSSGPPLWHVQAAKSPLTSITRAWAGSFVATAAQDGVLRVWDSANGELCLAFRDRSSVEVRALAMGADNFLIAGGADGVVREWRLPFLTERWRKYPGFDEARGAVPIFQAAAQGNLAVIDAALKDGTAFDKENIWNHTPFYLACERGNLEAAKKLLAAGARLEGAKRGGPPILGALRSDRADVVEWLLSQHADLGSDPWRVAAEEGAENSLRLLERLHVPMVENKLGYTPVAAEATNGNALAIAALADMKFDIEAPSGPQKWTPLQLAASRGYVHSVQTLLELGADPKRGAVGETPVELARRGGYYYAAKLIDKALGQALAKKN
jgi:serine/threonine protein kinase